MQAEVEYLVNNKDALAIIEKAGSRIKDYVLFKGAYHELHKEPIKDKLYAKVLLFMTNFLKDKSRVRPFGIMDESTLRHGYLKKRYYPIRWKRIFIIFCICYIMIGFL
jgi:hypothetical protein